MGFIKEELKILLFPVGKYKYDVMLQVQSWTHYYRLGIIKKKNSKYEAHIQIHLFSFLVYLQIISKSSH